MNIKAALYARVSTKEQAEEGYSLSAQVKLVDEYAGRRSIQIVKRFVVPESASGRQERKTFGEMLVYLKQHPEIKALLCEKVDRITRNFKDAVKLDDWVNEDAERHIHFVKQNLVVHKNSKSHEKFQWDMYLVLARQYGNNLSEEVKKGLMQKAEEGWYPGNQKRGYVSVGVSGHKLWMVDESPGSESKFIVRAFELYNTGEHTLRSASRTLFEEGWSDGRGNPISIAELHNILKDCFYCGEFFWNGKLYRSGRHPAIISKDLFYSVQDKLTRKKTGKYRKHEFLFKDLIKCGECGRSVVGEVQKGYNYYHCTRFHTSCTQRQYLREEELEKQLIGVFDKLHVTKRLADWIAKALKESHGQEAEYHSQVMADLQRQHTLSESRLEALYDDKLDGKITKEFYQKKFEQYSKQQEEILNALGKHQRANINYLQFGSHIFEISQKAKQIYQNKKTSVEKRSLLNFAFSNLTLKDKKLTPIYQNGFEIIARRAEDGNWLGDLDSNQDTVLQRHESYR